MYLSQGVDYLGFLNAKLRDLEGWSTLANELIQNADDASGATRIALDVTDDALIVSNDAQFSDCGVIAEPSCAWDAAGDGKKCCDFHAFRRVASGHKRAEEDTTGAFGIGFISVYQITDEPILRSGNWCWTLRPGAPEQERILAEKLTKPFPGTQFVFPWARSDTELRRRLGRPPLDSDVVSAITADLRGALARAAPFLKRLSTLELRINGTLSLKVDCERDGAGEEILVGTGDETRVWKRLTANFDESALLLRQHHGQRIEDKRKSLVTVGVPLDEDPPEHGFLYASLPTEHRIALPVLINADFYPTTNRKQILFDQDYQSEWNRAAIGAAAEAFASALPSIRDSLGRNSFWELMTRCRALYDDAERGNADECFKQFWLLCKEALRDGQFVDTSAGELCTAEEVRLNAKEGPPCVPLFEQLGLHIAHEDLRPHSNVLREVGVGSLDLSSIVDALKAAGLDEPRGMDEVPEWLRDANHRATLAALLELLWGHRQRGTSETVAAELGETGLWLTVGGSLAPASALWQTDADTRAFVSALDPDDMWAAEGNHSWLLEQVDDFDVQGLLHVLEHASQEQLQACHDDDPEWLPRVLRWVDDRRIELRRSGCAKRLADVPLWPSGGQLGPLGRLVVPGDFEDPLGLSDVVDPEIATEFRSLLVDELQARSLDLRTYLLELVPAAFKSGEVVLGHTRDALLDLVATQIGQLRGDAEVEMTLRKLPLARRADGEYWLPSTLYSPTEQMRLVLGNQPSHFVDERLVSDPMVEQALRWLGVTDVPRPAELLERVDELSEFDDETARQASQDLFDGMAALWPHLAATASQLIPLRSTPWLPAIGKTGLHVPDRLYAAFRSYLFDSQALVIDVARPSQNLANQAPEAERVSLFKFLGIKTEPNCAMVVNHLLHEAKAGRRVNHEVYTFLDQHHQDPAISRLRGEACLCIETTDGSYRYIRPRQASRSAHPFGPYRQRLSPDWLRFQNLLDALGIPVDISARDAFEVLLEMAEQHSHQRQLSEEDASVNLAWWGLLAGVDDEPAWFDTLANHKVVPSRRRFLRQPGGVYFDDRPGLAAKFGDHVLDHVIARPEMGAAAMAAAGVRNLSEAIRVHIAECEDPRPSDFWNQLLTERWPLIRRVSASPEIVGHSVCPAVAPTVYDVLALKVGYVFGEHQTLAEDAVALLDRGESRILIQRGQTGAHAAMARELALMIAPHASPGSLAAAIKEVLIANSAEDAAVSLHELGFADVSLAADCDPVDAPEVGLGSVAVAEDAADSAEEGREADLADGTVQGLSVPMDPASAGEDPPADRLADRLPGTRHDESKSELSGGEAPTELLEDEATKPTSSLGQKGSRVRAAALGWGDAAKDTRPARKTKFVGRSFVQPSREADSEAPDSDGHGRKLEVDERGTEIVMRLEREAGREPTKMDHFHKGFDIQSANASGRIERYIEVKSLSAAWDMSDVGLSAAQFDKAMALRERFWLYVVSNLDGEKPEVCKIQDPVSKISQYRFDDGWRLVAQSDQDHTPEGLEGS